MRQQRAQHNFCSFLRLKGFGSRRKACVLGAHASFCRPDNLVWVHRKVITGLSSNNCLPPCGVKIEHGRNKRRTGKLQGARMILTRMKKGDHRICCSEIETQSWKTGWRRTKELFGTLTPRHHFFRTKLDDCHSLAPKKKTCKALPESYSPLQRSSQ
jgi:hypothetical protein